MTIILFILIIFLLAITDSRRNEISNLIVVPAIFIGCILTGNWLWAGITFITALSITFADFKCGKCGNEMRISPYTLQNKTQLHTIAGGDTKLFTMISAFLGWLGLIIFGLTMVFLLFRKKQSNTAVAPYAFLFSILLIAITYLPKGFGM